VIVAAAIRRKSDGQVFSLPKPARHGAVMAMLGTVETEHDGTKWALYDGEQGFVDEHGTFYNRKQARAHAYRCGQHTEELIGSILTSEDLW
jgi:hypothetical protein